jgi:hypothetical protein
MTGYLPSWKKRHFAYKNKLFIGGKQRKCFKSRAMVLYGNATSPDKMPAHPPYESPSPFTVDPVTFLFSCSLTKVQDGKTWWDSLSSVRKDNQEEFMYPGGIPSLRTLRPHQLTTTTRMLVILFLSIRNLQAIRMV